MALEGAQTITRPLLGVDAEKATLGACLANKSAATQVAAILAAEDFALETDRAIAAAIFRMAGARRPVDPLTVAIELQADDELKAYLHSLVTPGICPAAVNACEYARVVREASLRRCLIAGLRDTLASLEAGGPAGGVATAAERFGELIALIDKDRAGSAGQRFTFRSAADLCAMTPQKPDWIVEGYVAAGCITEWGAKIKTGKTDTAVALAAGVLEGCPFLGKTTRRTPVVYVTEERAATFRSVLARHGLEQAADLHILLRQDIASDATWPEVVEAALARAHDTGAGLLITDTFSDLAGVEDENDAAEALRASRPLQLAAQAGLGVLATCHHRKGGGALGESRRGSSAFGGAVDIIVSLARTRDKEHQSRRELTAVGRFDEVPPRIVIERGEDHRYRVTQEADKPLGQTARQLVLALLPGARDDAIPADEVAKLVNSQQPIGRTLIRDTLQELRAAGEIQAEKNLVAGRPRSLGYWLQPPGPRDDLT